MVTVQTNKTKAYTMNLLKKLSSVLPDLYEKRHRQLIVLSGHKSWAIEVLQGVIPYIALNKCLLVSEDEIALPVEKEVVAGSKVKQLLGQEREQIIWDGFSGIHPDGLAASVGLLKAGGIFFFVIPSSNELLQAPDKDYARMVTSSEEMGSFSTNFLSFLLDETFSDPKAIILEQDSPNTSGDENLDLKLPTMPCVKEDIKLTEDQKKAVEGIVHVAQGRARRPLVIRADRGRGKSTALGIAAADLVNRVGKSILITGPNSHSSRTAFQHFERNSRETEHFQHIAPDALLSELPDTDLVYVDEAASIPATLLIEILKHYPRVVFSTTIHGYEGTGKGFEIRFKQKLNELTPSWRQIELTQPTRWGENDPLEQWIFNALCLNADSASIGSVSESLTAKEVDFQWLNTNDLIQKQNRSLLREIVGLLVSAHYQTSPSDIRMILDHPLTKLGVCRLHGHVIGVLFAIEEGGVKDNVLASGIIEGRRKPKNNLVPQALAYEDGDSGLLELRTYRVIRIAVHHEYQRSGVGSILLDELKTKALDENIDYLSSSFGYSSTLLDFWESIDFQVLRLGRHKDAASGVESIIVGKPLNQDAENQLRRYRIKFSKHFDFSLSRCHKNTDPLTIWRVLKALTIEHKDRSVPPTVEAFAFAHRALEETAFDLDYYLRYKLALALEEDERRLLVMAVFQGRDIKDIAENMGFTGKKAVEKSLRSLTAKLINKTS